MTFHVDDNGTIRDILEIHVDDNGTIRQAEEIHVDDNGTIRLVYSAQTTRSITVTVGQQGNIYGYGNFGAISTGSRTPTTVDGITINGLLWDDGGAIDDFVLALDGDQTSWDFISVTPEGEAALIKANADTPGGLYTLGTDTTTWTWSGLTRPAGTWFNGAVVNVDIIYQ